VSQALYFTGNNVMGELRRLKGLGPKSEKKQNEIGVYTKQDLE